MVQPQYKFPFFASLFLHIVLLSIFMMSFEQHQKPFVLHNANKIIEAMVMTEVPHPPSKIIQNAMATPTPIIKKTEPKSNVLASLPIQKNVTALAEKNKKIKEAQLQKQLMAEIEKEKLKNKKLKEKAVQAALEKELKSMQADVLREDMLKEQKRLANVRAAQMQGIVDKYKALILQAISQNWLVPPQVNKKLYAELLIHLAPGGAVLDVQLTKSSGDTLLDRSALAAVLKASPLPVPTKSEEFEPFRQFVLRVKPENVLTQT